MKTYSILESVMLDAEMKPDAYSVVDGNKALTYREFISDIARTATALKEHGVSKNDCVIVESQQLIEFLTFEFSAHALGAIFVPVEKNCPDEKIRRIAEFCGAKILISAKPRTIKDMDILTYEELILAKEKCNEMPITAPDKDDISEILFSTGTTGKEKGIVLSHKSDVAVAENIANGVHMGENNVEMIPSPLNHSHGLRSVYSNFINGGTVVIFDNIMNIKKFFSTIDEYHVNSMDLVPSALSMILKLSKNKFADYRDKLTYMEFGSAPMLESDKEKIKELLPNIPMYNFYGSTEAGRSTVYNFNQKTNKKGCIGKPTCNSKIYIVDDNRKIIDSSEEKTGLIACSGGMCMNHYYNDLEETRKAMDNGIIYTNDIAYIDDDGDIILLGRKGDVINIGGKKVAPEEIENCAKLMPGVVDCGCIAIDDANMGQMPMLFVQMDKRENFDPAKIIEFMGTTQLETFKIPKKIRCLDKIPRSFNGKLLRKELVKINQEELR